MPEKNHCDVDKNKRKFLLSATAIMGSFGAAAALTPFISSMNPSAKALAEGGPISVKVGEMKAGDQLTVIWRGKPIWIIRRNAAMLATLKTDEKELRDPKPKYAQNQYRSRRPEYLVLVGVCTHLGCSPTYRPDPKSITPQWPGGFFCSCHGSKFDLAGRVYRGVPAPINLEVPPYVFADNETIIIGSNQAPPIA
jgi:ubiquinol-cytochrome c reductase iron-sulfur subunit